MYNIISYEDNKKKISYMYNYFSQELNEIKNNNNINIYLLVSNNVIYGIFSFTNTTNNITILLLKIVNILDEYIKEFICRIINNIIIDFDNIYIHKKNVDPLDIFIKELYNYKNNGNYIEKNNIEENNIILHYKKNYTYNYFNCLLF